jgi:phytanoyl-CoA hydroxylase
MSSFDGTTSSSSLGSFTEGSGQFLTEDQVTFISLDKKCSIKLFTFSYHYQQIHFFHDNGYLVLLNFLREETVATLKSKMSTIISSFDLSSNRSVFTTKEQTRATDEYFLESGDKIRFFWEENAFKDGDFTQSPELCINKVGHNLHDLDEDFNQVSYDVRLGKIAKEIGMKKPLVVQV